MNPKPYELFAPVEILSDIQPDDFPFDWYAIAHQNHFWFRSRMDSFFAFASVLTDLQRVSHVLEIGCGNGLVRRQLEKRSEWITDGADINLKALELNQALRGRTFLYNIYERKEEFANKYDHLILFDVLEHIPDTSSFLDSCLFHLKPGGLIFFNVPALDKYKSRYDEAVGHIRRYDKEMMAKEFEGKPVEIIAQRYWAMSLVPLLFLRKYVVRGEKDLKTVVTKGLQPPASFVNSLLYGLLKVERSLFPDPKKGASLMAAVRKS